jgi:hypothetical protein
MESFVGPIEKVAYKFSFGIEITAKFEAVKVMGVVTGTGFLPLFASCKHIYLCQSSSAIAHRELSHSNILAHISSPPALQLAEQNPTPLPKSPSMQLFHQTDI